MTRVLLVDDDESNRLTLSALLEDDGFSVDLAVSFADATLKLRYPKSRPATEPCQSSAKLSYIIRWLPVSKRLLTEVQ